MITLQTNELHLQFDEQAGSIHSLQDGLREFVGQEIPVFKISLREDDGEQQIVELPELKLTACRTSENAFEAVYEGCGLTVTVTCAISHRLDWNIHTALSDQRVLEWVDFPRIAVPHELKDRGGTSKILSGLCEGALVDDLTYRESLFMNYFEPEYPVVSNASLYPGINQTPILAYYNEKSGLYLGIHEVEDNVKFLSFCALETGILLHIRHYCGCNPGESYTLNGSVVMQSFRGDWYDAAAIYKEWMKQNKSGKLLPIPENPALPEWYGESPIMVLYHVWKYREPTKLFPYSKSLPILERLTETLDSKLLALLMHWEGTVAWAPPYAWPPRGGEDLLQEFIDNVHAQGNLVGLYGSGIGWTQFHREADYNREAEFEEKHLRRYMCLSPKQELPLCRVVPEVRAGYNLCPATDFVEKVYDDQIQKITDAGVDYFQLMDQNYGGECFFCYSKDHGHPPVPGKWQIDAMERLYKKWTTIGGKMLFGAESAAAETYIPYLLTNDNRFVYNYAAGLPVPLYAFLYHEYINNFLGNQCTASFIMDHQRSPICLLERLAYTFIVGDFLTLMLGQDGLVTWECSDYCPDVYPDQEPVLTLATNANAWRKGRGKKYLHTGNMVKPCPVSSGYHTVYAKNGYALEIEKVHTSAWEASDGGWGQFLVNYETEPVTCEITLPEGNYRLFENETQFRPLSGGNHKLLLPRLSVILIEKA